MHADRPSAAAGLPQPCASLMRLKNRIIYPSGKPAHVSLFLPVFRLFALLFAACFPYGVIEHGVPYPFPTIPPTA